MENAPATAPPVQALVTAVLIQPAMAVLSIVAQALAAPPPALPMKPRKITAIQPILLSVVIQNQPTPLNQPPPQNPSPHPRRRRHLRLVLALIVLVDVTEYNVYTIS